MKQTQHWKLTIAPKGRTDPAADSYGFCKSLSLVGVGWDLGMGRVRDPDAAIRSEAKRYFRKEYNSGWRYVNAVVNKMAAGDVAWVYGDRGFHACRIASEWCHDSGGDWDRHDIHNFREAPWRAVPNELVPGHLRRHSTMRGTLHQIPVTTMLAPYLEWLSSATIDIAALRSQFHAELVAEALRARSSHDVFELLDPDDLEDVVCFYLQSKGWWLVKSSSYRSQRDFECAFQSSQPTGASTAWVQVKSGKAQSLDIGAYAGRVGTEDEIYLFSSASQPYLGSPQPRVTPIAQDDLKAFLCDHVARLPWHVKLRLARWSGTFV